MQADILRAVAQQAPGAPDQPWEAVVAAAEQAPAARVPGSLRHSEESWGRLPASEPITPAAVLVAVIERAGAFSVLLTRRAEQLARHAGQISFPGGRADPDDGTPQRTALREAEEEIGLPASQVEIVGRLDDYLVGTGYRITPVVGFVSGAAGLRGGYPRGRRGLRGAAVLRAGARQLPPRQDDHRRRRAPFLRVALRGVSYMGRYGGDPRQLPGCGARIMLRTTLIHILILLAPTILYFAFLILSRRLQLSRSQMAAQLRKMPWVRLLGSGLVLAAASLVVWAMTAGGDPEGTYVPARIVDGEIVPGEVID